MKEERPTFDSRICTRSLTIPNCSDDRLLSYQQFARRRHQDSFKDGCHYNGPIMHLLPQQIHETETHSIFQSKYQIKHVQLPQTKCEIIHISQFSRSYSPFDESPRRSSKATLKSSLRIKRYGSSALSPQLMLAYIMCSKRNECLK